MKRCCAILATLTLVWVALAAWADGPKDNLPDSVRRIPQRGIDVPAETRAELERRLAGLAATIDRLKQNRDPQVDRTAPGCPDLLEGRPRRARPTRNSSLPATSRRPRSSCWKGKAGPRSSKKSAPPDWAAGRPHRPGLRLEDRRLGSTLRPRHPRILSVRGPGRIRLDVWFHGRGETLSELNFLDERRRQPAQFTPADTIVLHPYGRYCNANKFAGEIDVLEAIDDGQEPVPDRRRPDRGPRLLDGGRRLLAVRRPLLRPLVRRQPRRRLLRDRRVPQGLPEGDGLARPGTSRSSGTSTTAPTTPPTCSSARPSPTAARSTARSRPPT